MNEQDLHEYNKWLTEVWCSKQFHIPFVNDAPSAYLKYRIERGSTSEFEKDLYKLINTYCKKGLSKPDLANKMKYITKSCELS